MVLVGCLFLRVVILQAVTVAGMRLRLWGYVYSCGTMFLLLRYGEGLLAGGRRRSADALNTIHEVCV